MRCTSMVWHVFVLTGTVCHLIAVYLYVPASSKSALFELCNCEQILSRVKAILNGGADLRPSEARWQPQARKESRPG